MKRANWIGAPASYELDIACTSLKEAFCHGAEPCGIFLVGSSLERRDFRDIDVRLMLADAEYDAMFPLGEVGYRSPHPSRRGGAGWYQRRQFPQGCVGALSRRDCASPVEPDRRGPHKNMPTTLRDTLSDVLAASPADSATVDIGRLLGTKRPVKVSAVDLHNVLAEHGSTPGLSVEWATGHTMAAIAVKHESGQTLATLTVQW
jgi:hypothetical protein